MESSHVRLGHCQFSHSTPLTHHLTTLSSRCAVIPFNHPFATSGPHTDLCGQVAVPGAISSLLQFYCHGQYLSNSTIFYYHGLHLHGHYHKRQNLLLNVHLLPNPTSMLHFTQPPSFNIGQLLRLLTVFGRHTSRIDSEDRRRRPMAKIED